MKLSARNKLKGTIVDVKKGATTCHVKIDVGGTVVTESVFTYPGLGPLPNFSCLGWLDLLSAISSVADELESLSAFSFLKEPIPLINVSIGDIIDFVGQLADMVQGIERCDNVRRLMSLTAPATRR